MKFLIRERPIATGIKGEIAPRLDGSGDTMNKSYGSSQSSYVSDAMDARSGLRTSIRLFSSYTASQLADMLEVSSGTRPATDSDGTLAYKDAARVPKEPWRSLNPSEMSTLFQLTGEWEQHRSVAILRPSVALDTLLANENVAISNYGRDDYPAISKAIVNTLAGECEIAPDYIFHGISRNDPNMVTVSINRDLNKLVGLHVDHWDGLPLSERRFGMNRISVNLGPSSRYILFMPATLEDLGSLLSSERRMHIGLPRLPNVFMQEFSDFPVVRCRLPPGASYIIPTENMLHDGSTAGHLVASRSAIFRGHIRPKYNALFKFTGIPA
jgi:hypothetical protein